jgi:hypothetical protein
MSMNSLKESVCWFPDDRRVGPYPRVGHSHPESLPITGFRRGNVTPGFDGLETRIDP